jgi:hypothetical protein
MWNVISNTTFQQQQFLDTRLDCGLGKSNNLLDLAIVQKMHQKMEARIVTGWTGTWSTNKDCPLTNSGV